MTQVRALRHSLLLLVLGLFAPSSALAVTQTYRIPFQKHSTRKEQIQPVRRVQGERTVRLHNPWRQGVQINHVISFTQAPDRKSWRRKPGVQAIDRLRDTGLPRPQDADLGQCLFNLILGNFTPAQIDRQALGDMGNIGYISDQEIDRYAEGSLSSSPESYVYFDSTSWHAVDEIRDYFGAEIPWERITEAEAPPGLTELGLVEKIRAGSPDVKLRLRRATLRLSMAQSSEKSYYLAGDFTQEPLPWQTDRRLAPLYHWDRQAEPIGFELNRGSQMKLGDPEEIQDLVRFAAASALQRVIQIEGSRPLSLDRYPVFIHSYDRAHTITYRRMYGAKPVAELPYTKKLKDGTEVEEVEALLKVSLGDLLKKLNVGDLLENWASFRQRVPEAARADHSLPAVAYHHAQTSSRTKLIAPRFVNPQDYDSDYSSGIEGYSGIIESQQFRGTARELAGRKQIFDFLPIGDGFEELVRDVPLYREPKVVPDRGRAENGLIPALRYLKGRRQEALLLTNFEPRSARRDPNYVRQTLGIYFKIRNSSPSSPVVMVFARDPELVRQFKGVGFKVKGRRKGFSILEARYEEISRIQYSLKNPENLGWTMGFVPEQPRDADPMLEFSIFPAARE
jgi:hypothetical protein